MRTFEFKDLKKVTGTSNQKFYVSGVNHVLGYYSVAGEKYTFEYIGGSWKVSGLWEAEMSYTGRPTNATMVMQPQNIKGRFSGKIVDIITEGFEIVVPQPDTETFGINFIRSKKDSSSWVGRYPTKAFWNAYKANKATMNANGWSCWKFKDVWYVKYQGQSTFVVTEKC